LLRCSGLAGIPRPTEVARLHRLSLSKRYSPPARQQTFGTRTEADDDSFLPPDALELSFLLLIHELTGVLAALGPVLLANGFSLELSALAHRALAGVVADRFVYAVRSAR
jgi:hypothetical protein